MSKKYSYPLLGVNSRPPAQRVDLYFVYCGKRCRMKALLKGLLVVCLFIAMNIAGTITVAEPLAALTPDRLAVHGLWIRTDAPYVIEIRSTPGSGVSLQAKYFNPKPVNVEKTETVEKNGQLHVLVVLQDVNYQDSYYFLSYNREKDILQGNCYHAASQQKYMVNFIRKPAG